MSAILAIHIAAGSIALLSGYAALFAHKGGRLHRKAGLLFVCAMVVMGTAATLVAVGKGKNVTALGGPLVAYLVITALITVRPPAQTSPRLNRSLMVLGLIVGAVYIALGVQTLTSGNAVTNGVPTVDLGAAALLNGVVGLLGSVGDFRVMRWGPLRGTPRLTRHLWRMCYALFTASGSFFLGQAQVIPKPLRVAPVLAFLAFLPLLAMLYWLVRARLRRTKPFVRLPLSAPVPSVSLLLVLMAFAFAPASAQSMDHARQLFDSARYAEAKAELLALQKVNDRNPQPPYYLGRIAVISNENGGDEAVRQFERAVDLEEGNALYHTWLGNAIREVTPRASKFRMPFNARRMKKEWERAVALDPNQIDARYGLVQFYSYAPGVMGGGKDKAREQAAEIAKRSVMRGAIARGLISELEKNAVAEEAAYREAIAAAPDSSAGYFALGAIYARDGKATEAFAILDEYVKRRPDDHRALYEAGRIAATTGQDLDRGEAALKQFLAAPPADVRVTSIAGAHYWLGQLAEKRGRKDVAREHYLSALKINPHNQPARRALDALQ